MASEKNMNFTSRTVSFDSGAETLVTRKRDRTCPFALPCLKFGIFGWNGKESEEKIMEEGQVEKVRRFARGFPPIY